MKEQANGQTAMDWAPDYGDQDFTPTPAWVLDLLMGICPPPRNAPVIDPFAGGGALLQHLHETYGWDLHNLYACEVREAERLALELLVGKHRCRIGSWYDVKRDWMPTSHVLTNVPFSDIPRAPLSCLTRSTGNPVEYAAILMPIEELAGVGRCEWVARCPPTELVSIKRRPFPGVRGVAWFVWQRGHNPLAITVC